MGGGQLGSARSLFSDRAGTFSRLSSRLTIQCSGDRRAARGDRPRGPVGMAKGLWGENCAAPAGARDGVASWWTRLIRLAGGQ
jgi:hypothetical protein